MSKLSLVVDGVIFQKSPHGGIARVFRELLPRMCELENELKIDLLIDGPIESLLPVHPHIHVRRTLPLRQKALTQGPWRTSLYPLRRLSRNAWDRLRQLWIGSGRNRIWHSTFFSYAPNWKGREVVTIHDMIPESFPQMLNDPMDELGREQKRRCVGRASAIICDSEATRRDCEKYYAVEGRAVSVIPLAHSAIFRPLSASELHVNELPHPFLLYVGNRVHYKNFSLLLENYTNWEKRQQVDLVVAGPPWSTAEKRSLESSGLIERIHLFSDVDDERLCQLYNTATMLVSPSIAEGFGLPVLEALACGCPVVASRIPATIEVAAECPIYFDLGHPENLVLALNQALQEGRDSTRTHQGLERSAFFTWDRSARATLEVYRNILSYQDATAHV
jgi:glycosyltransferase involved in cell wall biosynthesis